MIYHTAYPNWDSQAVVCHLFLYSFICIVHQQLLSLDCQNFVHTTLCILPILGTLLVQGFIFERGPTIFKIF